MKLFILIISIVGIVGCAQHYTGTTFDNPYGFFSGIWHGILLPISITINIISWILSIFGIEFFQDIEIMGKPNTGLTYYIGFFIGFSCLTSTNR